ncbi:MAG: hypothetical protein M1832_003809 [Thelocarpon impressellum]|nr:MAG: hypothetical protein M1832_003809 [Thelocarpon impressellum]
MTCGTFRERYKALKPEESVEDVVTLRGRVLSSRVASSKLVFLDLVQDGRQVQALCNLGRLGEAGVAPADFQRFYHIARRGDIFSVTGTPHRTSRGELSITATKLPDLLAPCLLQLPPVLQDKSTRFRNRQVDLLVNPQAADVLRLRSHIVRGIQEFLFQRGFLEVETPILADSAGGAIARPFTTTATEFPEKSLALRVAPELWLKRLIIGGFDRIFEVGPSFRNEGLDPTHNPEFTTCEFYQAYVDIEGLISTSEALIFSLAERVAFIRDSDLLSLPEMTTVFRPPFPRIDFIPAIEAAIKQPLPDLDSPDTAIPDLLALFHRLSLPLPSTPTLPRLLDKLSAQYLEPQCQGPTFITNHPVVLSPLAKASPHPQLPQHRVAARVELFAHGRELLNAYEEENDPAQQRANMLEQRGHAGDATGGDRGAIDEGYIRALHYGLPPTGGCGCGVDRLVMLFSGASNIRDVLAFGNLRNVVG